MSGFPNTPEYSGLNAPIGQEYELRDLTVEGRIPADVEGTFFRAVPDPAFPPFMEDGGAVLSGDGMVSAVRFAAGKSTLPSATCRRSATRRRWPPGARFLANTAILSPTDRQPRAWIGRSRTRLRSGMRDDC